MNNYNQSLEEISNANNTLEQQILRSKQQVTSSDPVGNKLTELSQVVGGEFTKSGFDTIAKNLAAKTGLQSLTNIGKNIKAKGLAGGLSQTATDAQKELVGKAKSAATDAVSQAKSTAQDAVSQAQSTAQDAVSQVQSTAQDAVSQAQSTATDAVSQAKSTAQDVADDDQIFRLFNDAGGTEEESSAWKTHPLYDAGQQTRLNLANKENLNKGKAPLTDEDKNLSPEDLRNKMDNMGNDPDQAYLDDILSRSSEYQEASKGITDDTPTLGVDDILSKISQLQETGTSNLEGDTESAVRSGEEQAGTGLRGDSTLARVLQKAPAAEPLNPGAPAFEPAAQSTPDTGGVYETQPPVSQPAAPTSTSNPEAPEVKPAASTQTSTPTPPVEEEEENVTKAADPIVDTGEETAGALAGLADPLVGAAEAGIGILGMILPDLFGGDDSAPTAPVPVGDILSGTSTMGLGN